MGDDGPSRTLLISVVALVVLQLGHLLDVLRVADEATFPAVLADPLALVGVGLAGAAGLALATGHRRGPDLAFVAGGAVAAGFLLHHGIPADLGGLNNPYWTAAEGSRADAVQWLSVVVIVALGGAIAVAAWSAVRRGRAVGGGRAVGQPAR